MLTFGGMKRICFPPAVFRFPIPLTLPRPVALKDDGDDDEGAPIGEDILNILSVVCFGAGDGAVDIFFSPKIATVSRSLPPPGTVSKKYLSAP